MSALLEGDEQLEQELAGDRLGKPATGSLVLHLALAAAVVAYSVAGGFFHANTWGGPSAGGAIRATITSTIPLPNDQPPNQNVLATEKPSPAPAPPAPKAAPKVDEKTIPIQGKPEKPQPKPAPKATPSKEPPPKPTNKAQYGEEAANNIPRAIQGQTTPGPTSVAEGDFGSRFGWYVNQINRKMSQTWNKFTVDPRTAKGTRVYITFSVARDGTPSNVQLQRSSGSPTLDRSCMQAAERVDTFGPLPGGYTQSSLSVSYYCEYD